MRSLTVAIFVLTPALAAAAPTPPAAPPAPPAPSSPPPLAEDPQVVEEAKRHFQQAVVLYNEGNYDAALAEFQAAYRLRPAAPAVLFNIGLTMKALFRYAEAIASMQKYLDESKASPEQRGQAEQLIREMKALLADVTLEIEPKGATVTLDGRALGEAPLPPQGVPAGNHRIEVTADGYKPEKRELMISAGMPVSLKIGLQLIPKTARVHVSASRPRALVTVDGKDCGFAPVDVELASGGHQLVVSAERYQTFRSELVVTPGVPRSIDVTLERTSHLYEKWYFWTPIAAVVAGAAIGLGVGLTQREGPIVGTLSPGAGRVN